MMLPNGAKNLLLAILIGGSALQCVPVIATESKKPLDLIVNSLRNMPKLKTALIVAFTAAVIKFRCTEPSNAPARVTWSEIKELVTNPKHLAQELKNNPKGTFAKFWYMTSDLIIGRAGEYAYIKGTLKDKNASKTPYEPLGFNDVSLKGPFEPLGIGGTIHAYTEPLESAIMYAVAILLLANGQIQEFLNTWGFGHLGTINAQLK